MMNQLSSIQQERTSIFIQQEFDEQLELESVYTWMSQHTIRPRDETWVGTYYKTGR